MPGPAHSQTMSPEEWKAWQLAHPGGGGFFSKLGGLVTTPIAHVKSIASGFKDNPLQALFGVDPVGAKIGSAVTGQNMQPLTNLFGGPTQDQFAEFERQGINTGFSRPVSRIADTVAGFYGGQGLANLAGAGISNLAGSSGVGGFPGASGTGFSGSSGAAPAVGSGINPVVSGTGGSVLGGAGNIGGLLAGAAPLVGAAIGGSGGGGSPSSPGVLPPTLGSQPTFQQTPGPGQYSQQAFRLAGLLSPTEDQQLAQPMPGMRIPGIPPRRQTMAYPPGLFGK